MSPAGAASMDKGCAIRDAIDLAVEETDDPFRDHLGASQIGESCARSVFYGHRWATFTETEGRMLRLWKRGHHEEARFLRHLRLIGAEVSDIDPKTGKQYRLVDHWGHYGGSCDGRVWNLERFGLMGEGLLEFKTHNNRSFVDLVKKKVALSKPRHYIQMQEYMGYMGLPWALYGAINKDNETYHFEEVLFNEAVFMMYSTRAERIIRAEVPPARLDKASLAWYECRFCDHKGVCLKDQAPARNCRTCRFSRPLLEGVNGEWFCETHKSTIPSDFQRKGCDSYEPHSYYGTKKK